MINPNWSLQSACPLFENVTVSWRLGTLMNYSSGIGAPKGQHPRLPPPTPRTSHRLPLQIHTETHQTCAHSHEDISVSVTEGIDMYMKARKMRVCFFFFFALALHMQI